MKKKKNLLSLLEGERPGEWSQAKLELQEAKQGHPTVSLCPGM